MDQKHHNNINTIMTKKFDNKFQKIILEYGASNYSGTNWQTNNIANTPEAKNVYNQLGSVGRLALDVIGLIPGAEVADIINAAWYLDLASKENDIKQRNNYYLFAGLSLISVIPTIGDVVGKGLKVALKGSNKLIKSSKFKNILKQHWTKIKEHLSKFRNSKLGKYIDEMIQVLFSFIFGVGGSSSQNNDQQPEQNSDHEGTISASDLVEAQPIQTSNQVIRTPRPPVSTTQSKPNQPKGRRKR